MVRVAVVRFPGSNCDEDARRGAEQSGAESFFVWHRDTSLQGADVVVLPGGFSYGDYLRSGAIARFSPIMQAVQAHAAAGGAVVGICNGFQILCEAHLLPGALMRNAGLTFVSKPVDCMVERTDTVLTWAFDRKTPVRIPVAHGEGRFVADAETLARLEGEGQVVLRYLKPSPTTEGNPNGSMNDIAGICNAAGTVVGIMPHPERVIDPKLGSADGLLFLRSLAGVRALAGVNR
jgi:phosphoribosylformylglycinamidine synthase I